ncbi:protein-methionine sulfoxide oxidase mical2 isoform x7 [Willisornis vidua]|uniref:F-actin monooxygenase n=1 Tax=Willisornis vidua TaxID=1566151 RepID=A0ABQ9D8L4_9PASS|nr:protein-methionine sulfoxide oxidase mical2 isoform x7 [Willisornis vidua]
MGETDDEKYSQAGQIFENFVQASTCKGTIQAFNILTRQLELDPLDNRNFYTKLKSRVTTWKAKALWNKLDKRASHKEYKRGKSCMNTKCLIIGGGPCGLRTAIELAFLGAKVVVVEKRDTFSRNNVLHLWPFTIHDLRGLGAKKFYGKFCAGSIDHISIRQLQLILFKVALILGVEIHVNLEFVKVLEPPEDQENQKTGWRAEFLPMDHPLSEYEFDVIIGADGRRNTLEGFKRKEFRGKLAIAITANFINRNTTAEAKVEEISGVAFIFNQKFFQDLKEETGIDLENIVYYKDSTHYFVMTAKKQSLLDKGVIINDSVDTELLLCGENVNQSNLLSYAREAADFATNYQLPSLDFAINHYGQPDVAMFDFTSMYASENAALVRERHRHQLLVALVGDSLLEPFWPMGTGCARGFLAAFDTAWMVRSWAQGKPPLEILAERAKTPVIKDTSNPDVITVCWLNLLTWVLLAATLAVLELPRLFWGRCVIVMVVVIESIYRLLPQTTPENINKNFDQYTIDPGTRYPNLNSSCVRPHQVRQLYVTNELQQCPLERVSSIRRSVNLSRQESDIRPNKLLTWCQKQTEGYRNVSITDLTTSWKSGLALCAIIHRFRPDLIDFDALNEEDVVKNNQLAFDVAEQEFGIPPVTTGKEVGSAGEPDKLSMVMYLSKFYELFRGTPLQAVDADEKQNGENDLGSAKSSNSTSNNYLNLTLPRKRVPKVEGKTEENETNKRRRKGLLGVFDETSGFPSQGTNGGKAQSDGREGMNQNKVKSMATQLLAKFEENTSNTILRRQNKLPTKGLSHSQPPTPSCPPPHHSAAAAAASSSVCSASSAVPSRQMTVGKVSRAIGAVAEVLVNLYVNDHRPKPQLELKRSLDRAAGSHPIPHSPSAASTAQSCQSSLRKEFPQSVGGSDICYFCKKRVYVMERLSAEGHFFHRECFKCEICSTTLRLGIYAFDVEEGCCLPMVDEPTSPKKAKSIPERCDLESWFSPPSTKCAAVRIIPEEEMTEHNFLAIRVMVTSDASSSDLESDFNGDSSNSEVSEGQTTLLDPPTCSSPIQRWTSLIRSPVVPEESSKTSKVADGFPLLSSKKPGLQWKNSSASCQSGPGESHSQTQVVVENIEVSTRFPFLQAIHPRILQLPIVSHMLQNLHQLCCPSLDTVQHLNVFLVVNCPKLNTLASYKKPPETTRGHFKPYSPVFQRKEEAREKPKDTYCYIPHHPFQRSTTDSPQAFPGNETLFADFYEPEDTDSDSGTYSAQDWKEKTWQYTSEPGDFNRKTKELSPLDLKERDGKKTRPPEEKLEQELKEAKKNLGLYTQQQPLYDSNRTHLGGRRAGYKNNGGLWTTEKNDGDSKKAAFKQSGCPVPPLVADEAPPALPVDTKDAVRSLGAVSRDHTAGQPKSPLRIIANAIKRSILEPLTSTPGGLKQDSESKVKASSEQAFFSFPSAPGYSISQRNSNNNNAQSQDLKVEERAGEYLGDGSPFSSSSNFSVASEEIPPRDYSEQVSFTSYTSPHTRSPKTTIVPQKSSCTRMEDVPGLLQKFTFKDTPPGTPMDDMCICKEKSTLLSSPKPKNTSKDNLDDTAQKGSLGLLFSRLRNKAHEREGNSLLSSRLVTKDHSPEDRSCYSLTGCDHLPVRKQASDYSTSSSDDEFEFKPSLAHKAKRALRRKRKLEKETKQLIKQEELKRLHRAQAVQRQLEELEERQRALEIFGVELERELRGEADSGTKDETQMLHEWFELVLEKNKLMRYESELLIIAQELELEDHQSRLEQKLREKMAIDDSLKDEMDLNEEDEIFTEMMKVVEERDKLVCTLEDQRVKEKAEDEHFESLILSRGYQLSRIKQPHNFSSIPNHGDIVF